MKINMTSTYRMIYHRNMVRQKTNSKFENILIKAMSK